MKTRIILRILLVLSVLFPAALAAQEESSLPAVKEPGQTGLELVAESPYRWTGVAVSSEGRVFVNFPRWSDDLPMSAGELMPDGNVVPYPDEEWNQWSPSMDPADHFVCVQSVYVDGENNLWILDAASPKMEGAVPGGPKLLKVNLNTNDPVMRITFSPEIVLPQSYLNDVRIDTVNKTAYITDSGKGALIVTDLRTGRSVRLLADHPSTRSTGTPVVIDGKIWMRNDKVPEIHADGIALSPDGMYLYYHALSASRLYRVPAAALREPAEHAGLPGKVEDLGETGPADGMAFGPDGTLYITNLPAKAILRWKGSLDAAPAVQGDELDWPDSIDVTDDGMMYVTTSRIHKGNNPGGPYQLFRISVRKS